MSINGFSVGKDVSVDIVTQLGAFTFRVRTGFESRPRYAERESHSLDGINRHIPIPSGWEGSLELDRGDNNVDAFFAATEALYYSGQPIQRATITETITNPDGSVSQYQFVGVTLMLREAGSWKGDDKTMMRMDFRSQKRNQIL